MRRHTWIVFMAVGFFAWLGLGMGFAFAQSNVIYPVGKVYPFPPNLSSPITISLLQSGADVTPIWLPAPNAQVTIQVNGGTAGSFISLSLVVEPGVTDPITSQRFATSAYPGDCTNYGTSTAPDYILQGNVLTSYDNGGMAAVIVNVVAVDGTATNYNFIIPQDSNFNGIPDIYEKQYGGNLDRIGDIDTGPDRLSPVGDGFANVDEYRGFRVKGKYIRGDPTKKDLFVHLVEDTLQCTATAGTFTGQSGTVSLATFFPGPLDLSSLLYMNVNTLVSAVQVHLIDDNEWVSNFSSYDKDRLVILKDTTAESATTDRWINKNAIVPLGDKDSSNPPRYFVKGVRIIQCLDLKALSPLGRSAKSPPDLFDKDNGNAVLFVHRIVKSMLNAIKAGGTRPMKYFTYEGNAWSLKSTLPAPSSSTNPSVTDPNVQSIMQIAFAWYLAHEAFEHSYDVTKATEGTYGYHHADGSGTNVDIKIVNKVDSKTTGFNNFYIPKYHGISDDRQMRVISSQVSP
jgi:hypothetical protein